MLYVFRFVSAVFDLNSKRQTRYYTDYTAITYTQYTRIEKQYIKQ